MAGNPLQLGTALLPRYSPSGYAKRVMPATQCPAKPARLHPLQGRRCHATPMLPKIASPHCSVANEIQCGPQLGTVWNHPTNGREAFLGKAVCPSTEHERVPPEDQVARPPLRIPERLGSMPDSHTPRIAVTPSPWTTISSTAAPVHFEGPGLHRR